MGAGGGAGSLVGRAIRAPDGANKLETDRINRNFTALIAKIYALKN